MKTNIETFFSDQNFDMHEPLKGHINRFEQKLQLSKTKQHISWKWLSVAASIVLVFTFWLGANSQQKRMDLADVSPEMKETQNFFVSTIYQELKTVEKYRNLETETIIEQALNALDDLEDTYKIFVADLTKTGNDRKIIAAMIKNYQQRLEILEKLIEQLDAIKNSKNTSDETFI